MKLSVPQTQRYARHILLDEVGVEGQLRLLATSVRVTGSGAAAEEAARYLVGAGVGRLVIDAGLLANHRAAWSDLNDEVVLGSAGQAEHTIEMGLSRSRLEGASAALRVLVAAGVEDRP